MGKYNVVYSFDYLINFKMFIVIRPRARHNDNEHHNYHL